MKLTFFFLLVAFFQLKANTGYAQATKISVDFEEITLADLFTAIEGKTEFRFFYKNEEVDLNRLITLKARKRRVEKILDKIFENDTVTYEIFDRHIIIKKAPTVSNIKTESNQIDVIQRQINGNVSDNNGVPLGGANIVEKGTTNGTQSDFDGNFSISVDEGAILVISYIGFKTKEIAVQDQVDVNVVLEEDAAGLDEVVVVGYGTQKKINLTGAVEVIDSEALENRPVNNVSNLLAGQAPGVTAISSGGQPGRDQSAISIRGNSTFGGSNAPLIIVDGVESSLDVIDPNDIESISVLKDASSSAIYGVRGGNGVIIVTTKRGREGVLTLNYNTSVGFKEFTTTPKFTNSFDYATLRNEALVNDGGAPEFSADQLADFQNGTAPNSDWLAALLTPSGFNQRHHLSLSGGGNNLNYNISIGYLSDEGLIPNTNFERYNFRVNLDQKVGKRLSIGYNIALSRGDITEPRGGVGSIYSKNFREHPTQPIQNGNGDFVAFINEHNSVAEANFGGTQDTRNDQFLGTLNLQYEIANGLNFQAINSVTQRYDTFNNWEKFLQLFNPDGSEAIALPNRIAVERSETSIFNLQQILTYEKTFGKHYFKALVGHNSIQNDFKEITASRTGLPISNTSDELALGDPATMQNNSDVEAFRLESYFGRLNYNYDERYLLEFSVRRDATSRFAPGNRTEVFPSFSAGWNISNESFFKIKNINRLKIRGSWGQLGNQEVLVNGVLSNFAFSPTFTSGRGSLLGGVQNQSFTEGLIANPDIRWETITKTNIGFDAGLFNNRLTLVFDYFEEERDDILAVVPISGTFGASAPPTNVASTFSKGFEASLGYKGKIGDEFNYSANINVTNFITAPEITSLPELSEAPGRQVGDPINNIFGYRALGLFQSVEEITFAPDQSALGGTPIPGDIRYADINGRDADGNLTGQPDGVVNADDRTSLGTYTPKLFFGLNLATDYKGFDLSLFFQGVGRVQNSLSGRAVHPFFNGGKTLEAHLDRWTPTNTDATYPALHSSNAARNQEISSFFTYDASYLRLKNIQFGYSLPSDVVEQIGVSRLRLYISADNLLTFTSSEFPDGFDPEVLSINPADPTAINPGNPGTIYPPSKNYTFGLNVAF